MDILLLKLGDTIKGDVSLTGYQGQIEILSFSHSISQPVAVEAARQPRASGIPQHQDMTFTKYLDLASAGIVDSCNRATLLQEVVFTIAQTESGQLRPSGILTMNDVLISSVSVSGGGGGKPVETITLNYTAIHWLYTSTTDASGNTCTNTASWDLAANAPCPKPA